MWWTLLDPRWSPERVSVANYRRRTPMSVIMALRLKGDPAQFEGYASDHPEMADIKDDAVTRGMSAHRFFGSSDGNEIIIVDEWPDAESFQGFYSANEQRIGEMMGGAGVS